MKMLVTFLALVATAIAQKDPNIWGGRSAIVHLFEWKFSDIAQECERFLAPMGYAGVQTSPVHENLIVPNRPWYERYQPLSYKIATRSGDENAFSDMVRRCNNVGVRIYVDVVFNHMTGNSDNAHGTGGSTADTHQEQYYAVPYGPGDFHSPCAITDYNDVSNVRNCELSGLHDLNQSSPYVQGKMIEFLNTLVDHGVAGFRVDVAKHMWPADLEYIFSQVKNLNTDYFPSGARPFIVQEVPVDPSGGEAVKKSDYTGIGRVTEFGYGAELGNAFRGNNPIKFLKNFGPEWNLLGDNDALVFIDNHDTQRGQSIGGTNILTYKDTKLYKAAVSFMLSWPYGYPRVMSSFFFNNYDDGPPSDGNGNILDVTITNDNTCGNGWVCEHRWRQIYQMVGFRNTVQGQQVNNWWDNDSKQIAYSRGSAGFIAFNDDTFDLKQTLQTGLPAGSYCDIISGSKNGSSCSGKTINVGGDGKAYIEILSSDEDAVLAIHSGSKL